MTLLLSSKLPAVILQYRAHFLKCFFFFILHFYMHSNWCTVGNLKLRISLVSDVMASILQLLDNQT